MTRGWGGAGGQAGGGRWEARCACWDPWLGTCTLQPLPSPGFLRFLSALPLPQLGEYAAALADYEAALALDPASSYAHYNAGIVRDRLGDYAGAVAAFGRAIALEPGNADFYHVRWEGTGRLKWLCGNALPSTGAWHGPPPRPLLSPRLAERPALHSLLPACPPALPAARVGAAEPRLLVPQDGAVRGGDPGLQHGGAGGPARHDGLRAFAGGLLLARWRPADRALCHLPTSHTEPKRLHSTPPHPNAQLHPGHTKARYNRAVALERLRQYEAAATDYSAVLQLDPGNAPARQNRGAVWLRLGRLREALADLDVALALDAASAPAWHARGEVHDRLGDAEAALADLQK